MSLSLCQIEDDGASAALEPLCFSSLITNPHPPSLPFQFHCINNPFSSLAVRAPCTPWFIGPSFVFICGATDRRCCAAVGKFCRVHSNVLTHGVCWQHLGRFATFPVNSTHAPSALCEHVYFIMVLNIDRSINFMWSSTNDWQDDLWKKHNSVIFTWKYKLPKSHLNERKSKTWISFLAAEQNW